jgi:hypothetical protein
MRLFFLVGQCAFASFNLLMGIVNYHNDVNIWYPALSFSACLFCSLMVIDFSIRCKDL